MARFIEEKKLSKRAQKELNKARRQTWAMSPVTRKVESKKHYNRKKKSYDRCSDVIGLSFYSESTLPVFRHAFVTA